MLHWALGTGLRYTCSSGCMTCCRLDGLSSFRSICPLPSREHRNSAMAAPPECAVAPRLEELRQAKGLRGRRNGSTFVCSIDWLVWNARAVGLSLAPDAPVILSNFCLGLPFALKSSNETDFAANVPSLRVGQRQAETGSKWNQHSSTIDNHFPPGSLKPIPYGLRSAPIASRLNLFNPVKTYVYSERKEGFLLALDAF